MYNYRPATSSDIKPLLGMLKNFSDFYALEKYSFYSDDEQDMLIKLSTIVDHHVCLVAEPINPKTGELGPVVGLIAGMYSDHFYNKKLKVLTELFWWVAEDHRSSRVGHDLVKKFIDVGKAKANLITLCILEKSPVKDSSLRFFGFKPVEKSFVMEV